MAMVPGKRPPASSLYPAQRRDGALSPTMECSTRHWLDPSARAKFNFRRRHMAVPFRERASEKSGRLNLLRMDTTTEAEALFDSHPRRKDKALLLDITIINPCASSNLENSARHAGKHLPDAVERKRKCRGSFLATYSLLPLATST